MAIHLRVVPVQGQRSTADMLSEGDYDGDHVTVCWDQKIVSNFVPVEPLPQSQAPERIIMVWKGWFLN